MASNLAGSDPAYERNFCGLLMDEMIIVNGIIYSVTHQKVYGLSDLPAHRIKQHLFCDFNQMDTTISNTEDIADHQYFKKTEKKLDGNKASGFTQVNIKLSYYIQHFVKCITFDLYLCYFYPRYGW